MNNERLQRRLYDYVSSEDRDKAAAYEVAARSPYLTALVRQYLPTIPTRASSIRGAVQACCRRNHAISSSLLTCWSISAATTCWI